MSDLAAFDLGLYTSRAQHVADTLIGRCCLRDDDLPNIGLDVMPSQRHAILWRAVQSLRADGEQVNQISLYDRVQRDGDLSAVEGESGNLRLYLAKVCENASTEFSPMEALALSLHDEKARERTKTALRGVDALVKAGLSGESDPAVTLGRVQELLAQVAERATPQAALKYTVAGDIDDAEATFDDELVAGVIGKATMAVLYGDSNSGKTFLAVDLAAAVSRNMQWMGRPVDGGPVIYLATEAAGSVIARARGYQRHHGVKLPGLVIVQSPINLFDGAADVAAVVELVRQVEREQGAPVRLIVGDTLARMSAGANENSGEDMGVVLRNTEAIRAATGATFLWIHHCGKDQAKGMRGWSGLKAAIETEIEVSADEATGVRTARVEKQRDLPTKGLRIGFKLAPVPLGHNKWGTPRGTCIVEPTDAPEPKRTKRRSEVAGAIVEFLTARGTGCLKGAIAKHFEDRFARQSVYREIGKLIDGGELIQTAGIVALPGPPGPNT